MDEDLEKLIESTAAETRRHFDVVSERLESKIDTIAEGVVAGNERTVRLETKVDAWPTISRTNSTTFAR